MADDPIELKLSAARTRLILDKPFLGALVLRLPMTEADPKWCRTTATDARGFYYNRQYIEALSLDQVQFVLAHEALHCALAHFLRRAHRVKHRWDLACDYAVNPLLVADGLKAPPGTLLLDEFDGMTAEEIYPCIDDSTDEETLDDHIYDHEERESGRGREPPPDRDRGDESGSGDTEQSGRGSRAQPDGKQGGAPQPPPLSDAEREALSTQWRQRLAGAAQQAMQAGKLSGSMARLVDHLLQPQLPWRMLLARYLSAAARDDYSFQRPSRREGAAILPSLRSSQVEVAVVLDTSGSIGDGEMREFLAEVNALKGQLRARVTLHACDNRLAPDGPWTCEPWEELTLPASLPGGGGTSFVPAFEWLARLDRQPDLALYFTDAEGEFPQAEPDFPVIWLVKGKAPVPWGQRIQLN
jgi:predicted metal-dependent peptidase